MLKIKSLLLVAGSALMADGTVTLPCGGTLQKTTTKNVITYSVFSSASTRVERAFVIRDLTVEPLYCHRTPHTPAFDNRPVAVKKSHFNRLSTLYASLGGQ